MSDPVDPLTSVTNERLGEVVSELKNEISNLNTEITTNLNVSMRDSMREMFKEFLGKPDSPKVDLPPAVSDLDKGNTLPTTDVAKANGKANANPEAKDTVGGTSTLGKPSGCMQVFHRNKCIPQSTNTSLRLSLPIWAHLLNLTLKTFLTSSTLCVHTCLALVSS